MRIFKGLNKNIVVLGVTSFFTDVSSEMLYPIIPIFLTGVLGAPMSVVGLIEGIAESAASVLKAFSGWISDKTQRRRPFVIGGYFLSSLGKLALFFANIWPVVLSARFIDRVGKGVRTAPRDALLADSVDNAYRGKAFGFHRAMDSLGACIGPIFAILLLSVLKENLRVVFLIAFIPAIISVLILAFFLKESTHRAGATAPVPPRRWELGTFSPLFKKFLLVSVIFAIGNSSDAFLIMRAKDIGLSVTMVILAYVVYNISYSGLSLPFGSLSDKVRRKWVIAGGYFIFAVVYLGFACIANRFTIWPLFFVYGFYMAMTDGVSKAFIVDTVEPEKRATALGIYYFTIGILALLSSVVAGLLWTYAGASAPFIYGFMFALASVVLCVFLL